MQNVDGAFNAEGDMEWTTEAPTEQGWYCVDMLGEVEAVRVVRDEFRGRLIVQFCGSEDDGDLSFFKKWYGPLTLPELPKYDPTA
jgi:hypothetical protein